MGHNLYINVIQHMPDSKVNPPLRIYQIFDASLKKKKKKKKTPFDIDSAFDGASGTVPVETSTGNNDEVAPDDSEVKELDDLDLDSFGKKKKKKTKKGFQADDVEAAVPEAEGQEGEGGEDQEGFDLDFSAGMKKKKKKKTTGLAPEEKDETNGWCPPNLCLC